MTSIPEEKAKSLDARLARLIEEGFSPRDAARFAALEREESFLIQLQRRGLHDPSPTELAAVMWKQDVLLRRRGNRALRPYSELRMSDEGKALAIISLWSDRAFDPYAYAMTKDGLRALQAVEIDALRIQSAPASSEHELRLDPRGLPVLFARSAYDGLPGDRTLDVILGPDGRTLADRPAFLLRYSGTEPFFHTGVQ
jgi:hypothetical protein